MNFKGKVVLITGASSGIGADVARHLSELGASTALVGRNVLKLEAIAEDIKTKSGTEPLIIVADVIKDAERIIDETISHFNKLDILINSAGITDLQLLKDITFSSFDRIFDINVRSVIRLTQLAVPHLEKTKGNIVNVSSVAGFQAVPTALAYCLSKAAINQFTKCISLELASKGIRVNSIVPGEIDTPIYKTIGLTDEDMGKMKENAKKKYPIGRMGQVEDTSNAFAFLANDTSSFITGVLLPVDGGLLNGSYI